MQVAIIGSGQVGRALAQALRRSGQAPMFTFENAVTLHEKFAAFCEAGKMACALCLPRDQHAMPWRIEDELRALGANHVQAGLWRGFAIRDGNLLSGQQNLSGFETAEALVRELGE
jgi:putative intracellular protease/amidase